MGYAIVTALDNAFYKKMGDLLQNYNVNKIPFGRGCNREEANRILNYHVTLMKWKEKDNPIFLPRIDAIQFRPCDIIITGSRIKALEDGGYILRFDVKETAGFSKMNSSLKKCMRLELARSLHITLVVDEEIEPLKNLKKEIDKNFEYPFRVGVVGLDLYHLWKPVKLAKRIRN